MSEPGLTYEDEQEALERELSGEVRVTAPQAFPEVNPVIFKDVEPILFKGFITQLADINGVPFVFKSINHHEFGLLSLMMGGEPERRPKQLKDYYNLFLSYGVLMVDGQNILPTRDDHVQELKEFFGSLPDSARQKVIRSLSEINRRAYRAVILTEAFAFEATSRLRWAQLNSSDLTSVAVTGIQGTDTLGLNWAQLTWRALNYFEDMKYHAESDWENAKFVASSMAGKGMSRIHSHDRTRRENERKEQIERRDKVLRHVLLGEPMDGKPGDTAQMKVASTVAELAEQLEKDLRGEKDWHDQVVEAYEQRIQDGYKQKAEQLQAIAEKHRQEADGKAMYGGTELQGLTPEEVRERVLRRRQLAAQKAASQIVYPELYDERYAEFMEKWNIPRPAELKTTDKDPSTATPLAPPRPPGTPWRGGR